MWQGTGHSLSHQIWAAWERRGSGVVTIGRAAPGGASLRGGTSMDKFKGSFSRVDGVDSTVHWMEPDRIVLKNGDARFAKPDGSRWNLVQRVVEPGLRRLQLEQLQPSGRVPARPGAARAEPGARVPAPPRPPVGAAVAQAAGQDQEAGPGPPELAQPCCGRTLDLGRSRALPAADAQAAADRDVVARRRGRDASRGRGLRRHDREGAGRPTRKSAGQPRVMAWLSSCGCESCTGLVSGTSAGTR